MMTPSLFHDNFDLFDRFFQDPWLGFNDREYKDLEKKLYGHRAKNVMNTDIKESDSGYEMIIDLPGFKKEEVNVSLENGYLTISAETSQDSDEKDEKTGRYIRRERYYGSCSRSFYVGRDVKQEDVKARFEDGVLKLTIPKMDAKKPEIEQKKLIAIEG